MIHLNRPMAHLNRPDKITPRTPPPPPRQEVKWLRHLFLPSGVGIVIRTPGGVGYGTTPDAEEDADGVPAGCPSRMILLQPDVIRRFARHGSIGIGEAYMEQQWVPEPNTPDGLKAVLVRMW